MKVLASWTRATSTVDSASNFDGEPLRGRPARFVLGTEPDRGYDSLVLAVGLPGLTLARVTYQRAMLGVHALFAALLAYAAAWNAIIADAGSSSETEPLPPAALVIAVAGLALLPFVFVSYATRG